MKQRLLFYGIAGSLLALTSCQRTQYAAFNKPATQPIERIARVESPVTTVPTLPETEVASVVRLAPNKTQTSPVPAPTQLPDGNRTVTWAASSPSTPEQGISSRQTTQGANSLTKLVAKRIEKIRKKQTSHARGKDRNGDTLALLSLIFGGVALLFLLAETGGTLTLLLGVAGFVLGLISLNRTSKKTMAILGTIFGGIIVLLALLAIVS